MFVERPWKSAKYEDVYLKAYESVSAARAGIARPHRLRHMPAHAQRQLRANARHDLYSVKSPRLGAAA